MVTNSKARDKIRAITVLKTPALSDIILKRFHVSILCSLEWALSSLPTELATSQTSAYQLFKKITGPFSGLLIWEDRTPGRSPTGRTAVQQGHSTHWWSLIARPHVGRAITTGLLNEGPLLPHAVWLQEVLSHKSENTITDIAEPITKPMIGLLRNHT